MLSSFKHHLSRVFGSKPLPLVGSFLMGLFLMGLVLITPLTANRALASEWRELAQKTVDYKAEVDKVKLGRKEQNLASIKLRCDQGTVNLKQIELIMSDGESKKVDNLGVLTKGLSSRAVTVPKSEGHLERIELAYDSVGSQALGLAGVAKKGKITVLGKEKSSEKEQASDKD
ncbi:hypothetical protein [Shewanella spartinae]|uniref:hypothetical protein n=1 Tax=Shewanella spartinae TaxID=2864205 RepID=UPI001C660286|nr:hypothetical protein [Shewanella spartinae]QYJ95427.1 hypothetical protein K0I31_08740 [Shewanella spartinae]